MMGVYAFVVVVVVIAVAVVHAVDIVVPVVAVIVAVVVAATLSTAESLGRRFDSAVGRQRQCRLRHQSRAHQHGPVTLARA
jgi:uncharacterized membrane protein